MISSTFSESSPRWSGLSLQSDTSSVYLLVKMADIFSKVYEKAIKRLFLLFKNRSLVFIPYHVILDVQ